MTQNATKAKKSRSFTVGVSFWLSSYYSLSPTIKQSNRERVKENRWKRKSKSRYIEFTPWTEHGHPTFFDRKGLNGHFLSVPSLSVPSLKRTTPKDFLMFSFMSITYQKKIGDLYCPVHISGILKCLQSWGFQRSWISSGEIMQVALDWTTCVRLFQKWNMFICTIYLGIISK